MHIENIFTFLEYLSLRWCSKIVLISVSLTIFKNLINDIKYSYDIFMSNIQLLKQRIVSNS